jgi:parvulin-like peptidyl-prolyl isomerase
VGDDAVTTHEFQAYARYMRFQYIQQYAQYASFAQMFGTSAEETQTYLAQYWSQVNYQLEPNTLGQDVLDQVINFSLVKQYADENGIVVSKEDIDRAVEEFFGYYPSGTPTTAATREIFPTSTLSAAQMTLVPPTATATMTATVESTESAESAEATPTATLEPTATLAPTATASGPTATSEPLPTPTEYTEDAYKENYNSYVDYLDANVGISSADLRWIIEMRLYQDAVYEIITADVAESQDQVWARHIVVADEATALDVLNRLENGEDFATLAAELSQDTTTAATGGDLGWFAVGVQDTELEKVAFNLNIGQLSEPIQTTAGWEIVQTLGHEVRQLTNDELEQARSSVFQIWLDEQRDTRDVQVFDIWTTRVPTVPTLPPLQ